MHHSYAQVAKPQVSADRTAGPAGTAITLRGHGWPEGTRVLVSLGGVNSGASGRIGLVVHNADSSLEAVVMFKVTGR